jgi:hypothetical protein
MVEYGLHLLAVRGLPRLRLLVSIKVLENERIRTHSVILGREILYRLLLKHIHARIIKQVEGLLFMLLVQNRVDGHGTHGREVLR